MWPTYCCLLINFPTIYRVDLRVRRPNMQQLCVLLVQHRHLICLNHLISQRVDRVYQPIEILLLITMNDVLFNILFHIFPLTFKSGMWNLKFSHRLFCLLVTLFIVSHVCWHVLSPGAEINQYSDISVLCCFKLLLLIQINKCLQWVNWLLPIQLKWIINDIQCEITNYSVKDSRIVEWQHELSTEGSIKWFVITK